ncbi:MAG: ABC transporter ATP-binding protein, partial [Christensenellales bacterium]
KEKFGKRNPKNIIGKLSFKDVDFSFDDAQVLKNFSLEISPNQSIAIVGKSGQGKSTMLNLITRLYDVDKGCITLDDIDIKTLSEKSLRDNITIVPQTPYIFNTTIRENLSFVKPDLTDEEMIEVCKKAQIHDFIVSKKDGYDSIVGENGVILSGGQKQRLAIARALLKNSKIIMLDEATSALDNENQYKIQQIINSLKTDHTIIIVAHRLSTIIDCDKIVFMENGQIIGCGSHKQLLHSCKQYKDLYTIEENSREN